MTRSITSEISEFIVCANLDSVPQPAIDNAKGAFLDCLGVSLAGTVEPIARIVAEFVREMGGNPSSTVIGAGLRTSPPLAALANGTLAHALDYDDGAGLHIPMHPTAPVLPAVLALGEQLHASGRSVLEAYVLGLEVEMELASCIGVSHYRSGWHTTGTVGTLGAAAAAAKILGLDAEATCVAFGIAGSTASGLRRNFGSMTKPFHAGNAARNGVVATLLARRGFTASPDILETENGFCNVLAGPGNYDLESLTPSSLAQFALTSRGVTIKKYPSCYSTHTIVDSTLALAAELDVAPEEIEKIVCDVTGVAPDVLVFSQPTTPLEGKFSAQFCVAAALVHKRLGLEHFNQETLNDPRIRRMVDRTELRRCPDLEGGPVLASIVTVHLRDGREYSRRADVPRGHWTEPLTWDEICNKFRACAGLVLRAEAVEQVIESVQQLESLRDVNVLMEMLALPAVRENHISLF